ncbi:iron-containing alcohol dehydrogenase [Prosthecomicrobium sp. N25]|uniref:iron-containing alcohol dehydrogenase n=1 Tax=Prosthecomicrobium sp. N25 TaxID=3129254 RepID=UPI003076C0E2
MTLIGYLTRTHFAEAAIEDALPEEAGDLARALVLVDREPGVEAALDRIREALCGTRLTVVEAPPSAPSRAAVAPIARSLRGIPGGTLVAIGGAAAVGQARLVAEQAGRRGEKPLVIAVPVGLFDLGLARQVRPTDGRPMPCPRPDRIIADPTVLDRVPGRRLAASAMETLVHAMEAYASPGYNPPADGLALEAVRRMTRWLPVGLEAGGQREARRELMAAALTAGLAMEKAVGGVDALACPIEAELGAGFLPGDVRAPLLAAVAEFNAQAVGDRYAALARTFAPEDRDLSFSREIGAFARTVGMPTTLREVGIDRARFDRFAEIAASDPASLANPRRMTPVDCRRILEAAW